MGRNHRLAPEGAKSWSNLQTKHWGPEQKLKEPQKTFLRDQPANIWGARSISLTLYKCIFICN